MKTTTVQIKDKTYEVKVAETQEEKEIGLSRVRQLPEDAGMLFPYEKEQPLDFTMEDTAIDLDIIFISEDLEVVQVDSKEAFDEEYAHCDSAQYVLEVNINSGISVGDEVDLDDISEEDKNSVSKSKMLVLDADGNVQMKLEGGERIISIKDSKRLIRKVLTAYHSDNDEDYIKVGKDIFKIFDGQDEREPEYVEAPN